MKKNDTTYMYYTGICEDTVSKRTIISVIAGLKKLISENIYIVTENKVIKSTFADVVNREGCIFLKGFQVRGVSLFDLYQSFSTSSFFSVDTKYFISILHQLINASALIYTNTGSYPIILLNSVFIEEDGRIVFLPYKLIEFLNKYRNVDEQKILSYHLEGPSDKYSHQQHDFTLSLALILYLFFSKNQKGKDPIVLDISNFMEDTPRVLSDAIWEILHGRKFEFEDFSKLIQSILHIEKGSIQTKVPLFRTRSFSLFKHSFKQFFIKKKTLLIIVIIVGSVLSYLLFDYFTHRKKIDYTLGLEPRQVVELYFHAVDTLDLDVLDSIFYKRSGREIKDEVSRIYVISQLEQAIGSRLIEPEELEEEYMNGLGSKEQRIKIYGLKDVEIHELRRGENPIFFAKYKKYISAADELSVFTFKETIYLKEYSDHWYIIKIERKITD